MYANKNYCSLNVYVNGALITVSCAASCNSDCKTTAKIATTTSKHITNHSKSIAYNDNCLKKSIFYFNIKCQAYAIQIHV